MLLSYQKSLGDIQYVTRFFRDPISSLSTFRALHDGTIEKFTMWATYEYGDVYFNISLNGVQQFLDPLVIIGGTGSVEAGDLTIDVVKGDIISLDLIGMPRGLSISSITWQADIESGIPEAYGGTSTTSRSITIASKQFDTQRGLGYIPGVRVIAVDSSDPTKWMEGVVTSYTDGSLTVNVDTINGTGTITTWAFSLTGHIGLTGSPGSPGSPGADGADGADGTGVGVPVGGTTGQILTKASSTDYDSDWEDPASGSSVPVGGTTGQVLTKLSATDGDADWESPTPVVGTRVHKTTNQNISNNAWTALIFDVEDVDTLGCHDNSTNNTRFTIPTTGWYIINGVISYTGNTTGVRYGRIFKNATSDVANFGINATASFQTLMCLSTLVYATAGDYFELMAYQNSGGGLDIETPATHFEIVPFGSVGPAGSTGPTGPANVLPFAVACSDEITPITTGQKVSFRAPVAFSISAIRASLTAPSTSGTVTVDVKVNGTSVFSTLLTIDVSEGTSVTAATAAVLTSTPFAVTDDDLITIHVTGAGTAAEGLKVTFK